MLQQRLALAFFINLALFALGLQSGLILAPRLFLALGLLQRPARGFGLLLGELFVALLPLDRRGIDQRKCGHRRRFARLPVQAAQPQQADAGEMHGDRQQQRQRALQQGRPQRTALKVPGPVHCSGGSPMNPIDATPACCSSTMVS